MSSNQTKTDGKTASVRKGSASYDQQKRMTSITRKMHGYLLRKKFFRSLGTDLLTGVLLVIGWCAEQEFSALGSIAAGRSRFFTVREIAASPGAEFLYMITSGTGKTLLSVSFLYPFIAIACILGVLLAVQILGLLFSFYRETKERFGRSN